MASNMKVHVLRLVPGQEVKTALEEYVKLHIPRGAFVISCIGSVTKATLRHAEKEDGTQKKIQTYLQHFEVLSMSGTLSKGGTHLHICLCDQEGATLGGHVMGDLQVFTTMEVVLGEPQDLTLDRTFDAATGYKELTVKQDSLDA